ncbi:hypothetical protein HBH56_119430 [Parastagonospora nodorum]|uniref:Uncharacterized protein n=1 Tax=Phaeosphaeria nodorum (strain SN15 / ATCC MYA-4574 / FGSC 10173) TaxID=321614 RepID=A0A7U2I8V0_PHANO|nr:hypothetical protein HBH56_119430 [Parastagonospora nodorum]QRD05373.1 hypothetical protein JI435_422360 [Parastagonospora nodorum SN15]KAH3928983.1 hypothetical protein HBH54_129760 [Parastagonospora nodorum]KAH3959723.1 hypothetical protein HBH51_197810 [Parastagonospora nodorum]KAH4104466.1 hypothetical protein HBH46_102930 [Parastagonospora nodorum]
MGLSVRTFLTSIVRVNNTWGISSNGVVSEYWKRTGANLGSSQHYTHHMFELAAFLFTRLGVLDLGSVSRHERGRTRGLEGGSDSAVS